MEQDVASEALLTRSQMFEALAIPPSLSYSCGVVTVFEPSPAASTSHVQTRAAHSHLDNNLPPLHIPLVSVLVAIHSRLQQCT